MIPKPRERNPGDKIKGKGKSGGRPVRDVRRPMTAKLRKELAEQKRGGQESPADIQAVDQVEQTGAAAFDKVGREAEHLIDRAVHPDHRPRERTEAIRMDDQRPRERMKRQAAKDLEHAGHTEELPTSPHYGGRPPEAVSSKSNFSPANQSIYPSAPSANRPPIKERPRRYTAPR